MPQSSGTAKRSPFQSPLFESLAHLFSLHQHGAHSPAATTTTAASTASATSPTAATSISKASAARLASWSSTRHSATAHTGVRYACPSDTTAPCPSTRSARTPVPLLTALIRIIRYISRVVDGIPIGTIHVSIGVPRRRLLALLLLGIPLAHLRILQIQLLQFLPPLSRPPSVLPIWYADIHFHRIVRTHVHTIHCVFG
jgi:hypothetical protein